MPIIFAQAIMFAPALLATSENNMLKHLELNFQICLGFGIMYYLLF